MGLAVKQKNLYEVNTIGNSVLSVPGVGVEISSWRRYWGRWRSWCTISKPSRVSPLFWDGWSKWKLFIYLRHHDCEHTMSSQIGISKEECSRVLLSLKKLTITEPLSSVRFWGKMWSHIYLWTFFCSRENIWFGGQLLHCRGRVPRRRRWRRGRGYSSTRTSEYKCQLAINNSLLVQSQEDDQQDDADEDGGI